MAAYSTVYIKLFTNSAVQYSAGQYSTITTA